MLFAWFAVFLFSTTVCFLIQCIRLATANASILLSSLCQHLPYPMDSSTVFLWLHLCFEIRFWFNITSSFLESGTATRSWVLTGDMETQQQLKNTFRTFGWIKIWGYPPVVGIWFLSVLWLGDSSYDSSMISEQFNLSAYINWKQRRWHIPSHPLDTRRELSSILIIILIITVRLQN